MATTLDEQRSTPPDAWDRALARGECLHCGGPLGRHARAEDGPFCCRGCRTVFDLIHQRGLTPYYDLRRGPGAPVAELRPDSFTWLDHLVAAPDGAPLPGPWRLSLDIQGVHCAACVWLLERLFRDEPAGIELRINPALGQVDLAWDPARGDLKRYLAEVERFGYRLGPRTKTTPRRSRSLLVRMAVCVAIAMNVMMFSLSFYFGLAPEEGALFDLFGWLSLGLATVSVLAGGPVFFRAALAGLRRGLAHLDLPISLGMTLAYAGSVYAFLVHGPHASYFDTLTVFVALMLVGRYAQENVLERNRLALLADGGERQFMIKRLQRDGTTVPLPAGEVQAGDELWIAPGDVVPVAGILLRRPVEVALDWITGEPGPVAFAPGDVVPAGAFNSGRQGFTVSATEPFATSGLRDLLRTPPVFGDQFRPRWWHRVSRVYVAAVLALATLGFVLWAGHDLTRAISVTIAILVITCPCALGLAAPLAEELTHHALRRRGVFLRKASFLEKALHVRQVLLDKTGTLTLGELVSTDDTTRALAGLDPAARGVLAVMTGRSNHPISRAVQRALGATATAAAVEAGQVEAEAIVEEPGLGLRWALDGREWRFGRAGFALAGGPVHDAADHTTPTLTESVLAVDGRALARLTFTERYRADAAAELAELARRGYSLHLLSGDTEPRVRAAAAALGIPAANVRASLSPEAKAARVRELDREDTLMVGDGLNDGPSFAAAFSAATPAVDRPVLPGRADFYFLGDGIAALRRALDGARRLRRVVRDNLILAVIYNVGAVALSLAGHVDPVMAAVLMPASSLAVVGLTLYRLSPGRSAWTS